MAAITPEQAYGIGVVRFMDLIAFSEGTSTSSLTRCDGYDVIVTGVTGPEIFDDFSTHPFACGREANLVRSVPRLTSTAAGRYQLLLRYWKEYQKSLKLPDFGPLSQDLIALQQLRERHTDKLIEGGHISTAIESCANIWASLPGNSYGQGGHSMETLLAKYDSYAVPDLVPDAFRSYAA